MHSTIPAENSGMHHIASRVGQKLPTFAQAFDPKNNAFGFLRLTLAVLVIFSHSFPLGGFGIDALGAFTHGKHTIGLVSVAMFFVLSGFLICRSASGSVSVTRFLWHRFLRIFPAYWICLVVCACVFAPLVAFVEHGTLLRVFSAPQDSPQSYMLGNAGLFHLHGGSLLGIVNIHPQTIAGLLRHNPFPYAINGSLWTLPFEVGCYVCVAALAVLGVVRRARGVVLILFVALWSLYAFSYLNSESFHRWLPVPGIDWLIMLSLFFCAGCVCFLYREKIPCSGAAFATCVAMLAASLPFGMFGLVTPIFLTYAFLWLAFNFSFPRFDAQGDFSYGTYIYAFPVQQGLALFRVQEGGFGLYFVWSLLLTFILAILSYRLIEAPCLRWKKVNIADVIHAGSKRSLVTRVVPRTHGFAGSSNISESRYGN